MSFAYGFSTSAVLFSDSQSSRRQAVSGNNPLVVVHQIVAGVPIRFDRFEMWQTIASLNNHHHMKIKSINRELCGDNSIAITTDPKLTGQVYEKFRQMLETDEQLGLYLPTFAKEGTLIFSPASFPPGFRENIERLLSSAESYLKHAADVRQEKSDHERSAKEQMIQAAAKALGVPIE